MQHPGLLNRVALAALSAAAALLVAACGGGGDGGTAPEVSRGQGPGNPAGCPHSSTADTWLNNRLGCLAAGQRFVNVSAGATGDTADRAYIVKQQVLDMSLQNVLGGNLSRYFKHALCVRGAPGGVNGSSLTSDLGAAVGLSALGSGRSFYPPTVSGSTLEVGGVADSIVQTPCNPAVHPVIVNYSTGFVESVSPAALSALMVFDQ